MTDIGAFPQEKQVPRSFLRDLVSISSLPEMWIHRTPLEIAEGLDAGPRPLPGSCLHSS